MAKIYDKVKHDIMWSDCDIYGPIEDAYWELSEVLATKKLDGHDMRDQWYMTIHRKLAELLDVMEECPFDELDPNITELS